VQCVQQLDDSRISGGLAHHITLSQFATVFIE